MNDSLHLLFSFCLVLCLASSCSETPEPPQPTEDKLAGEIIFYDWAEDMPQSVLDDFFAEYGVKVSYLTYQTTEEASKNIEAGNIYDVVVLGNSFVAELAQKDLLAPLDHRNIPNFKHISPAFRDLLFDPGNVYSVTFNWGLTGLLVRSDLVEGPVSRWLDLWDPRHAGRIHLWNSQRDVLGIALKSLGYSINSENPTELEAALQHLLTLRGKVDLSGYSPQEAQNVLAEGKTTVMYGWAGDALRARAGRMNVNYILPADGNIQWGDNFVIPANSARKHTAEVFINFIMRPAINARIVNEQHYATANASALPLIQPEILNDRLVFPASEDLRMAEIYMPLSVKGLLLRERVWQRFLQAVGESAGQKP